MRQEACTAAPRAECFPEFQPRPRQAHASDLLLKPQWLPAQPSPRAARRGLALARQWSEERGTQEAPGQPVARAFVSAVVKATTYSATRSSGEGGGGREARGQVAGLRAVPSGTVGTMMKRRHRSVNDEEQTQFLLDESSVHASRKRHYSDLADGV